MRARARGVAIRDGDRAVAVAFLADGSLLPSDTLVRYDVTHGEDASRLLGDALTATGARGIWFYGGDETTRRAVVDLDLQLRPAGAAFVYGAGGERDLRVTLRPPSSRDHRTLVDLQRDHAPSFKAAHAEIAEVRGDAIGITLTEPLDQNWSEIRVVVYPTHRGQGFGAALLAAAAERVGAAGRRACAATETIAGPERVALERAGFRLSDYYFIGSKR